MRQVTPDLPSATDLADVRQAFIDPAIEIQSLRRAAVLVERVRQDGAEPDPRLDEIASGLRTLQRAAAAGRWVHHSAIERLRTVLANVAGPTSCAQTASVYELLRCNAIVETGELLGRLAVAEPKLAPPTPLIAPRLRRPQQ